MKMSSALFVCYIFFCNQRPKSNNLGEISLCLKRICRYIEFAREFTVRICQRIARELERTIKYKFEFEFDIKYKFEFASEFAATIPRDRTRTHYAL